MRERVAEGGSSWDMIGSAPSTGIERQEVNVFGGLLVKSEGLLERGWADGERCDLTLRGGERLGRRKESMYSIVKKRKEERECAPLRGCVGLGGH